MRQLLVTCNYNTPPLVFTMTVYLKLVVCFVVLLAGCSSPRYISNIVLNTSGTIESCDDCHRKVPLASLSKPVIEYFYISDLRYDIRYSTNLINKESCFKNFTDTISIKDILWDYFPVSLSSKNQERFYKQDLNLCHFYDLLEPIKGYNYSNISYTFFQEYLVSIERYGDFSSFLSDLEEKDIFFYYSIDSLNNFNLSYVNNGVLFPGGLVSSTYSYSKFIEYLMVEDVNKKLFKYMTAKIHNDSQTISFGLYKHNDQNYWFFRGYIDGFNSYLFFDQKKIIVAVTRRSYSLHKILNDLVK